MNNLEELKKLDYSEILQLKQEKEITTIEFILLQEELNKEFQEWIKEQDAEINEESANKFLYIYEEMIMNSQYLGYHQHFRQK